MDVRLGTSVGGAATPSAERGLAVLLLVALHAEPLDVQRLVIVIVARFKTATRPDVLTRSCALGRLHKIAPSKCVSNKHAGTVALLLSWICSVQTLLLPPSITLRLSLLLSHGCATCALTRSIFLVRLPSHE